MAIHRLNFRRIFSNIHRSTVYSQNNLKQSAPSNNSTPIDLEDALDNFTTELMQKKKNLWDMKNEKFKSLKQHMKTKHFNSNFDVQSLSEEQLNEVFNCALVECNDVGVIEILKKCLKFKVIPSRESILQVLNICAQNGELDLILNLEELCESENIPLPTNFNFEIYKGHAVWIRGNVIKGLEIFQELYRTNPFMRRPIRIILKQLITMGIKNNSEAVLIHFVKVAKDIVAHHKDYFLLVCIWEYCFISEWYSDQDLAIDILIQNRRLAELLINRLPFLVITNLKNHRKETVYKLLECFHNMKMAEQCTIVAMALLDHHFLQVNIGSYSEVIKWCKQSNIVLPSIYNQMYLSLLLKTDCYKRPPRNKLKLIDKSKEFVF